MASIFGKCTRHRLRWAARARSHVRGMRRNVHIRRIEKIRIFCAQFYMLAEWRAATMSCMLLQQRAMMQNENQHEI